MTGNRNSMQKRAVRDAAWQRQKGLCCYCKRNVPKANATLEHRVALADGGGYDRANLAMSCRDCNGAKGNMPEAVFLQGAVAREEWKRRNAALWRYRNGVPGYDDASDSDGSSEAGETRSGSTEGDSAGPKDIAQPQPQSLLNQEKPK